MVAAVTVAAGGLSWARFAGVWGRVWPVLAFLLLIKVASDLLDEAGVFDVSAHAVARLARGRTWVLFMAVSMLCTMSTTLLSLDATAVLMTPVAIRLARELRLSPVPFVMACLWLANTASLMLPVSNLTNLLAQERSGWSAREFVAHSWAPQLVLLAVTIALLAVLHRNALRGRYDVPRESPAVVRIPFTAGVLGLLGFAVAVVVGVQPWVAAGALVVVLLAASRGSFPGAVRRAPWGMAAFALGLFVVMAALAPVLDARVIVGSRPGALRIEGVAAVKRALGRKYVLARLGDALAVVTDRIRPRTPRAAIRITLG